MRIEFSLIGDGTNARVELIEELSPGCESTVDRVYSEDHQGFIHFGEDLFGVPVSARQLFEWVEDSWAPPVIGGKYGYLHPYWHEREEARKRRCAGIGRKGRRGHAEN